MLGSEEQGHCHQEATQSSGLNTHRKDLQTAPEPQPLLGTTLWANAAASPQTEADCSY